MNRHILTCLALIFSFGRVLGQQPPKPLDPPELVAARAEHLRAMHRASIQPLSNYLRSLQSLQQFFVRQGKAEAVTAVAAEIAAIKEKLDEAQAGSNLSVAAPLQLQIEKAVFGDLERNRVRDVTKYVQDGFASGKPVLSLVRVDMMSGHDPAPGVKKFTKITYIVNGKRKEKLFEESQDVIVDFKKDLK
jgi:hypothetical protein